MTGLFFAVSLYFATARPVNWQAGIGIVQDVRIVSYPDGRRLVQLRYSDGRRIEVNGDTLTLLGPQADPDAHADCDQIYSAREAQQVEPW